MFTHALRRAALRGVAIGGVAALAKISAAEASECRRGHHYNHTNAKAALSGREGMYMKSVDLDRADSSGGPSSLSARRRGGKLCALDARQQEALLTVLRALKRTDRAYFSEVQESELFLHALHRILEEVEGALPAPYFNLCNTTDGMSKEEADGILHRLEPLVMARVSLPYLDESMKLQAVRGVTELVVGAMRKGTQFDEILGIDECGPIIMNIWVKGNAGGMFSQPAEYAETLAAEIEVPFIPHSWKIYLSTHALEAVSTILEEAIMSTYTEVRAHVERAAKADAVAAAAARARREEARIEEQGDTDHDGYDQPRRISESLRKSSERRREALKVFEAEEKAVELMCIKSFDTRVREATHTLLLHAAPAWVPSFVIEPLVRSTVEFALSRTIDACHMNASVEYLLDQHRIAKRLSAMPHGVRTLLLRRKEKILPMLLSLDEDGTGSVSRMEFNHGVTMTLGLAITMEEADALFVELDTIGDGLLSSYELERTFYGRELDEATRTEIRKEAEEWRRMRREGDGTMMTASMAAVAAASGGGGVEEEPQRQRNGLVMLVLRVLTDVGRFWTLSPRDGNTLPRSRSSEGEAPS